jgi:phosphatidylserine/phosphatidylglycerophosphate/cardiolipin synthase-like enzyme
MPVRALRTSAIACGLTVATVLAALPAHAASDPYSAFVFGTSSATEPTIYNFIEQAASSLDMTMYELSDTTVENDLISLEASGVDVRVILDQAEKSTNQAAYTKLEDGGVGVVWSSTAFTYTHQKTITINNDESLILSGNLTSTWYTTTRDYGVFDSDANDVNAIVAVFNDDYKHDSITPSDGDNLLWSPTTAQSRLLTLVESAKTSIDVEEEEFSDTTLINALVKDAEDGVTVRVVVEDPSDYSSEIKELDNAGAKVVGYPESAALYIHAKAIVVDYGLSDAKVEVGSMNWTSNSLGDNRELGIILSDTAAETVVENQFDADFAGGTAE